MNSKRYQQSLLLQAQQKLLVQCIFLTSADRRPENVRVLTVAVHCWDSQSSSTFTMSAISQSFEVTPAAIAGVIFSV